jgi:hypothetical protein
VCSCPRPSHAAPSPRTLCFPASVVQSFTRPCVFLFFNLPWRMSLHTQPAPSNSFQQSSLTQAFRELGVSMPNFTASGGIQWTFVGRRQTSRASQRCGFAKRLFGGLTWTLTYLFPPPPRPTLPLLCALPPVALYSVLSAPTPGGLTTRSYFRCYSQSLTVPETMGDGAWVPFGPMVSSIYNSRGIVATNGTVVQQALVNASSSLYLSLSSALNFEGATNSYSLSSSATMAGYNSGWFQMKSQNTVSSYFSSFHGMNMEVELLNVMVRCVACLGGPFRCSLVLGQT